MTNIFVFDTNSLISANLLPNSVTRRAYDIARKIGISVYSIDTLAEFADTFIRPKFDKYLTIDMRLKEISAFEEKGQLINISVKINACRDSKDNKFLELAVESGASCIITGDLDLLVLNPFQNIPILTAAEFLKTFSDSKQA
ncbi:putative toxin-antitoxin system toxin component, PIN family [Mucilaginibacter psychrotolerans]|uniref:Putative toxin-antitoxin system toxin component, PIN family n=1 Tax=Mucilaginibacter psychrotolerans TaxID=1524096 RepID=A0A4Y8SCP2_9SPHI|nr:putative toxin-antitoxin system toxin component, PIN family [Mucilaginibacter psychrotolerans]TFF36357.1 putative toxin-antitoxin system toxin component, PIN family [Mucilaginibacter psychrotolerans]